MTPQRSVSHHGCGGRRRRSWRVRPNPRTSQRGTTRTCESLGIKPELKRSLGFLSNFAVAFSYISVSTGTFTQLGVAFGVGGPAIFWAWPIVILGQTFVALNFAELVEPLSGRGLDLPVVEAAVEPDAGLVHRLDLLLGWRADRHRGGRTVPLVLSTIYPDTIKLADPSPIPSLDMHVVHRASSPS